MPKFWGVFLMPIITVGMLLLFLVIPSIDPLKANIAAFRPVFNLFIVFIIAFMVYLHFLTLAWSLGYQGFRMSTALLPFMGLLFILVGYMLRSAKRNFFIGIRTPWTLSSDRVWDQTHRIGAVLFMLCGAIAFAGSFFGGPVAFWLILCRSWARPLPGRLLLLLYRREPANWPASQPPATSKTPAGVQCFT
jgi:uncharacterized membrane protein